jgi:transcriptional regulatory protein RtcR
MTESLSFLKSGIETRNAAFNALIERIERVAINSSAPLLLMGPTGSGKSNLARRIYQLKKSRRQVSGPFVEMNCATLRGDAAMSALFGHKRGAFTGAIQDRPGLLRAADKGVLFLDEVGELGTDEQAMLLRALEEKTFLPVGADKEVHSDFQLIAGTNRDLAADVRAGRFREDLLARINLWTFKLPALRDRPEDIEPNLRFELEQFASRFGTNVTFNLEARQRFLAFATSGEALWSGNFRDLNAAVTRMATLAGGGRITVAVVEDEIERLRQAWAPLGASDAQQTLVEFFEADRLARLDPFDRCQLAHVIDTCRKAKSLSDAGRTLFAATRQLKTRSNDADRLRKYLSRFDLDWSRIHPPRI